MGTKLKNKTWRYYCFREKLADMTFSSLHGSKGVTNIPVKGSGRNGFYRLEFMMETPFTDETTSCSSLLFITSWQ